MSEENQNQTDESKVPTEDSQPDVATEPQETTEDQSEDTPSDFREQQKAEAAEQNLQGDNAVPEQRPQSFFRDDSGPSDLTKRLEDEGAIPGDQPMGQEAYDAADDEDRKEKTAKEGKKPTPHVGTVIIVNSGPHRGRVGAVLRIVTYASLQDATIKQLGTPQSDYVEVAEIEVAFRGDDRDGERVILDLTDTEYEIKPNGYVGRGSTIAGVS